jgi:hypothetical protein
MIEHYLGLDAAAVEHDRESGAMFEKLLGREHPDVQAGHGISAIMHIGRGDHAGAERLLRQVIESVGKDDLWWQWQIGNRCRLAEILIAANRLEEARRQLAQVGRLFQSNDSGTYSRSLDLRRARFAITRGDLVAAEGDEKSASDAWREALSLLGTPIGGLDTAQTRLLRVAALLRLGRSVEARPDAEALLAMGWKRPEWLRLAVGSSTAPEDLPVVLY